MSCRGNTSVSQIKFRLRSQISIYVEGDLDAVLKQQGVSKKEQSNRSKMSEITTSTTSLSGRRDSSCSKNAESKEHEEVDQPVKEEALNDDVEVMKSKEDINSMDETAIQSTLPFDKMSSLEVECFPDLQGPFSDAFIEIRNRILKMWFGNPKKQLTEYAVQQKEAPYNSDPALVLRTHAFLETHGFINCGMYKHVTPVPNPPNTDLLQIKREPEETQHPGDELPLDLDGACSLYEDHQIKEEMVIGPTVFHKQTIEYLDVQQIKREPEETRHPGDELPLDPDGACSLYEDHQIKEEMVIGPTVFHKQTIEYSVVKKTKPRKNKEAGKLSAEKQVPTARRVDKIAQRKTRMRKNSAPESKLPDMSVRSDIQHEVSKKPVGIKNKVKINKTADKNPSLQSSKPVTKRAKNEKSFLNKYRIIARVLEYTCDICDYSTNNVRNLKAHSRAHAAAKKFCCDMCSYITTEKRNLIKHLKAHSNKKHLDYKTCETRSKVLKRIHTGEKSYTCDMCCKSFILNSNLNKHRRLHSGEKPYSCDICYKSFNAKSSLVLHRRIHTGEKRYSCDVCHKSFNRMSHLDLHRQKHTGKKPYSCDVCLKRFNYKSYLANHRRIHTGNEPYSCEVCLKNFNYKSSFTYHQRIHTGEKPYSCNVCNKSFSDKAYSILHRRIHTGEKPYSCDICHKSFNAKSSVVLHRRIHTGEKPYSCDVCDKSFIDKGALVMHRRIHTGEKLYSCDVCLKSFNLRSNLVRHLRLHTGAKPYSCDVCLKTFNENFSLIIHKRIHVGEKPYSCVVCEKSFYAKYSLNRHLSIHTTEKPYSCDVCNKSFKYKFYLNEHRRRIHRRETIDL